MVVGFKASTYSKAKACTTLRRSIAGDQACFGLFRGVALRSLRCDFRISHVCVCLFVMVFVDGEFEYEIKLPGALGAWRGTVLWPNRSEGRHLTPRRDFFLPNASTTPSQILFTNLRQNKIIQNGRRCSSSDYPRRSKVCSDGPIRCSLLT